MKKLLAIALIAISCSDDEPCFSCDQMRAMSSEAYESWQLIQEQKPAHGTLKQITEWYARNEKAKSVYLNAASQVSNNCYDKDYRRDY